MIRLVTDYLETTAKRFSDKIAFADEKSYNYMTNVK